MRFETYLNTFHIPLCINDLWCPAIECSPPGELVHATKRFQLPNDVRTYVSPSFRQPRNDSWRTKRSLRGREKGTILRLSAIFFLLLCFFAFFFFFFSPLATTFAPTGINPFSPAVDEIVASWRVTGDNEDRATCAGEKGRYPLLSKRSNSALRGEETMPPVNPFEQADRMEQNLLQRATPREIGFF